MDQNDEESSLKMVENSEELSRIDAPDNSNSTILAKEMKLISFSTNDVDTRIIEADSLPALIDRSGIEEEKKDRNPWDFPEDLDLDNLPEEQRKLWVMR